MILLCNIFKISVLKTLDEIGTCKTRIVSIGDDDFVRSVSPPFPDRSPMRSRSISSGAVFELGPQSLNVQPTHLRPKFLKVDPILLSFIMSFCHSGSSLFVDIKIRIDSIVGNQSAENFGKKNSGD